MNPNMKHLNDSIVEIATDVAIVNVQKCLNPEGPEDLAPMHLRLSRVDYVVIDDDALEVYLTGKNGPVRVHLDHAAEPLCAAFRIGTWS